MTTSGGLEGDDEMNGESNFQNYEPIHKSELNLTELLIGNDKTQLKLA
jgi:hypothetical protein